ncbi:GAF domain-containing protein [Halopelagius inordinatus]|uniref:GAF domain-containing protein n=1 Tax=Halopelagius inordinatus TaxID=553467 RepID=A0A1I2TLZ7_9EURY|nr:bacterio-opsin activator domain-containing protein [Halopelagius inordinatus]SFG63351.1 GAF domain-containing protein [Halopelagius inordinatus]
MDDGSLTECLRETLALFEESGAPQTTTEVSDRLDVGRRSTYERLERLVERDRLQTKAVGASARVWWRPSPTAEQSARACDGREDTSSGEPVDAAERQRAEETMERQEQRLAALNSLNQVVREITDAVIDQSTREEIERTVCERLADTESYLFAWTGDVDSASRTVRLRTEAGVEGYLDGVTISVDPADDRSGGPTGRAFNTGEVQTTRETDSDPRHDPWRDHVRRYGFRSSAAVPIIHEGTVYAVLNVYADRPNAFEGEEGELIGQLGEVVGHAIAAIERKRALMCDEVVELEFHVPDVLGPFGIEGRASGLIRYEHTVPRGDGEFVLFGRTTPDGAETVRTMAAEVPFYDGVTFRDCGDETAFELRVSEPPVLSAVASLGGSVERAVIEDGDYHLTVHLSPSADVRRLLDAMVETHPAMTLLRRRQLTKRDRRVDSGDALTSSLTDRQRAALEIAYRAGFFEWPRDASGEDVAGSMGVAAPTFHQHLRAAEKKVFESLFSPARR